MHSSQGTMGKLMKKFTTLDFAHLQQTGLCFWRSGCSTHRFVAPRNHKVKWRSISRHKKLDKHKLAPLAQENAAVWAVLGALGKSRHSPISSVRTFLGYPGASAKYVKCVQYAGNKSTCFYRE